MTLSPYALVVGLCAGVIFYTYFGYPILLWCWKYVFPPEERPHGGSPMVTAVIAVYNEEQWIEQTILSILASDYPFEKLDVLVVSDASIDATDEIVSQLAKSTGRVRFLRQNTRQGKRACLARAYPETDHEILLLTDAGVIFKCDTVKRLMGHFMDPKVGSVVGSRLIRCTGSSVSKGEWLYWQYETMLRKLEDAAGACWSGCEGALFAVRRPLYSADFEKDLAEDSVACYRVFEQNYINRFDGSAVIEEYASTDLHEEFQRKVRVIARGIRAMLAHWHLMNPYQHPLFFFQNVSHRFLRWLLPLAMVPLWVASGLGISTAMDSFFWIQTVFYALGAAGVFLRTSGTVQRIPWFMAVPAYFVTVNSAAVAAWSKLSQRFDVWKRTERGDIAPVTARTLIHQVLAATGTGSEDWIPAGQAFAHLDGTLSIQLAIFPLSGELRIPQLRFSVGNTHALNVI